MTCLPPCAGCVEVSEQLETWRNASGWGDLHAEEVDSSKRPAHHMRCDECGRMVVLGREITPAPTLEPQQEQQPVTSEMVGEFLLELRSQLSNGIDCNKLARICYHKPRAARTIDLITKWLDDELGKQRLCTVLGMRVSYHADRWLEQGKQGLDAAEKFGCTLLEEACAAWNAELPAPPKPVENYVIRNDAGRPLFVLDLDECDAPEWVSWTRRRQAIQARDREVNKSIREANKLIDKPKEP